MGMLDNLIGGTLGGVLGGVVSPLSKPVNPTQPAFMDHIGITDGDAAYDTMAEVLAIIGALAAGSVWTKIWEKTYEAQRTYRWGFGSPAYPHNQGYMWFCSLNTNVDFQVGKLRLVQANHNETEVYTVRDLDDTRLHTATVTTLATATPTSINEMVALPEQVKYKQVGEDSKLQLWYRCITAATAEDNVGFSIPVTVRQ